MIKSNFLFCILIFFLLFFDRFNIFLFCIISSVIHESVHIALYMILYKQIPSLRFSIFGISLKNNNINPNKNLTILIFAPLTNILIAIIGILNLNIKFQMDVFVFSYINLILGILNLLPIEYLDGGRVYDIVFYKYSRFSKIFNIISLVFLYIIVFNLSQDKIKTLISLSIFSIYFLINVKKS